MQWTPELLGGLGGAVEEATVFGIVRDVDETVCRVLLEVVALPEIGPIDPDPRRVLVLSGVTCVEVLLRRDPAPAVEGLGPAIPLSSLGDLDRFFASLAWTYAMYSWEFIDDTENPKDRWPAEPSLRLVVEGGSGAHSFYWFTECGVEQNPGEFVSYLLEGIIWFDHASVERGDGSALPLEEFIADAYRWWRAFREGDARLSVDAQRAATERAPSWRPDRGPRSTTFVPAGE
jgi:hypothetical protein